MKFEKLTQPGQIGRVKTKNRMVKPAQSMGFSDENSYVSENTLGHYEALAMSGVGLINVEAAGIDFPLERGPHGWMLINNDKFIPRLTELAEIIHKHDVPCFLQLIHWGPAQEKVTGFLARSASDMPVEEVPRPTYGACSGLTTAEVEDVIEKFVNGAARAQKAGFDGVEIHAAHGYLLNAFFSSFWNHRTDAYGGSIENRARIACEIIKGIKQRLGADFPVGIRVNGAEYGLKNGLTNAEMQTIARLLQQAGADDIHVSAFGYGKYNRIVNPEQMFYPEPPSPLGEGLDGSRRGAGALTPLAAGVKKAVTVPVIAVGRLDPVLAETILREGKADFVAMGRLLLADPQAPRKIMEGRAEEIAPCTACLMCIDRHTRGLAVACRVNAALGREREYAIKPATQKKRVMVVGGGPAGMEAARVAALRGHDVTLYEKESKLGGAMRLVSVVKGLEVEDLKALARYFTVQLDKLGVKVKLSTLVDTALITQAKPDALILATGGIASIPEIPGMDSKAVISQARLHKMIKPFLALFGPELLRWLTNFYMPLGKKVVIIGGAIHGIELAEFLVRRGRKVTVVETSDELGAELVAYTKQRLLLWLQERGCTLLSGVKYEEIDNKGLTIVTKDGKRQTLAADAILSALPLKPNTALADLLKGKVPEVYVVGDARDPHLILEAVADGYRTAMNV